MEYIFVSPDDKFIAVIYQDESEMALLNQRGYVIFKMRIGPSVSDLGFLSNDRIERIPHEDFVAHDAARKAKAKYNTYL